MLLLLLFMLGLQVTSASIEFTNSTLYDVFDFTASSEIRIARCDNGCQIFASTVGEGFIQYPEGLEPYAMNIIVRDNTNAEDYKFAKLAQRVDMKKRKIPLLFDGPANVSVINTNGANDNGTPWAIAMYVVDKPRVETISYEVFDAYYSNGTTIVPEADTVTIMSANPFRIDAAATQQETSVTARLVGFDNALDSNSDGCPYAYKTPDHSAFPGFSIQIRAPIISFSIKGSKNLQLAPSLTIDTGVRDLANDGFLTSPGWNGCTKPQRGGLQSFRTPDDYSTASYMLTASAGKFNVDMDVLPNVDENNKLDIEDMTNIFDESNVITGSVPQSLNFSNTKYLTCDFQNMRGDQGFLLRYSSTPDSVPDTTTSTPGTTSTLTSTTTSPSTPPTTSAGYKATGIAFAMLSVLRI